MPWSHHFYDYESHNDDRSVFETIFNLITELGNGKNNNITAAHCNATAKKFIHYVNAEKNKIAAAADRSD
ncbi:MAG: hypothetical protein GY755_08035, partial [Chloroflexi bacterium]|nr:hypothetical protein [Chloroflexota bacterium]